MSAHLPQQASDGVQPRGARSQPPRAQPVERGQALLVESLDGHGRDLLVAMGLQKRGRVGSIGLVAQDVAPGVMRR